MSRTAFDPGLEVIKAVAKLKEKIKTEELAGVWGGNSKLESGSISFFRKTWENGRESDLS